MAGLKPPHLGLPTEGMRHGQVIEDLRVENPFL
ncbi:hypothetical protein BH18ACT11_BH18ACT11_02640 [soil metagenome]